MTVIVIYSLIILLCLFVLRERCFDGDDLVLLMERTYILYTEQNYPREECSRTNRVSFSLLKTACTSQQVILWSYVMGS
jgi:hypothetical protein